VDGKLLLTVEFASLEGHVGQPQQHSVLGFALFVAVEVQEVRLVFDGGSSVGSLDCVEVDIFPDPFVRTGDLSVQTLNRDICPKHSSLIDMRQVKKHCL
jgi:hypothetical protein